MNLLDRYIGQSVITGVATVLTIFIILYELFSFAGETNQIGRADYTVWSAMQYSYFVYLNIFMNYFLCRCCWVVC